MTMQKAWDKDVLIAELKAAGLPDAEVLVEKLLATTFTWVEQSLVLTGGLQAAVGLPLMAVGKPMVFTQVDKIDGQPG